MTPEQFCYWMQGFVELSGGFPPTTEQWHSISEHLQTVFKKETPPVQRQQDIMDSYRQIRKEEPLTFPWDKHTDIIC